MIFLTIFAIIFLYIFATTYKRWKKAAFLTKHFPMPPTVPVLGHMFQLPKEPHGKFVVIIDDFLKKYGNNVLLMKPFYDAFLIVANPNDVETLLANSNSKSAKKSLDYQFLEPWLGTGLLTSYGEKWFQRRKIITPGFHFSILDQFVEIFSKQSDIFIEHLKSKTGEELNIYNPTTLFALDVICETAMGITLNAQSSPDSEYVNAVKEISLLLQNQFFSPLKLFPFLYSLSPNGRRKTKVIKIAHAFTSSVISKRRDYILNNPEEFSSEKKKNFLDILLHATVNGNPLTDEDIREEVDTFMFEGHDTTTSGISFSLYHLSLNQDVQQKVYEELCEVFEYEKSPKMTSQTINNLKYLDMVIKECLRLNPSVPFMGRSLTEPTTIGGATVPAGTNISIGIYAMHHNPEFFSDPEKFDPNRFDINNKEQRHPFAYIPFSAGARNCVGKRFAMMELKSVVAKIVLNFKIFPASVNKNVKLQSDLILKSANGIYIRLENREK